MRLTRKLPADAVENWAFRGMWTACLACACLATSIFPSRLSEAAELNSISRAVQPFVDRHEIAGAVTLVASKDKVVHLEAVGYADLGAHSPMRTDAVFWIASMTKTITGAAVMMLVDEGKVRLDDAVQKYLPDFAPQIIRVEHTKKEKRARLRTPSSPITIRQLLANTNGLRWLSSIEGPTIDTQPLNVRVQSYALAPLLSEPGSKFTYSNAGFNTAARIVEIVSGMSYEDFLEHKLFGPLGMKDTTFWPDDAQLARLAKVYRPATSGAGLEETSLEQFLRYPLDDRQGRYPEAGAGLFSTAQDVARFGQMVLNRGVFEGRRYLSEIAVDEMTRDQLSAPVSEQMRRETAPTWIRQGYSEPTGYGIGWATYGSGAYGHPGAYKTQLKIDPVNGLIMVWMVQYADLSGNAANSWTAFETAALAAHASH